MLRFVTCKTGASLGEEQLTVAQWLLDQGADPAVSLRIPNEPFLQVPALHAAMIASAAPEARKSRSRFLLITMMLDAAGAAGGAAK